ncbi:hypothetical protein D3C85_1394680 [compost metagenome]
MRKGRRVVRLFHIWRVAATCIVPVPIVVIVSRGDVEDHLREVAAAVADSRAVGLNTCFVRLAAGACSVDRQVELIVLRVTAGVHAVAGNADMRGKAGVGGAER